MISVDGIKDKNSKDKLITTFIFLLHACNIKVNMREAKRIT